MTDLDLTTGQQRLLHQLTRTGRRLHRNYDGTYWLDPEQRHDLPVPQHPEEVEPLIDAGLLTVRPTPNIFLGHRIDPTKES